MYPVNSGVNELQSSAMQSLGAVIQQMLNQGQISHPEVNAIQNTINSGGLVRFCNDFGSRLVQYNPHTGQQYQMPFNPTDLHQAMYTYVVAMLNQIRQMMRGQQQVQIMQPQQMGMPGVVVPQGQTYPPGTIVNGVMVQAPSGMMGGGMINQGMTNAGGNPLSEVYGPKVNTQALLNVKVPPSHNQTELRNAPVTRMEYTQPVQAVANPVEVASATNTIYKPNVVNNAVMEAIRATENDDSDFTLFGGMTFDEVEEDVTILDRTKENEAIMEIINTIGGQKVKSMVVYGTDGGTEALVMDVEMHSLYSNWDNAKNDFMNTIRSSSIKSEYPRYFYHLSYYEKVVVDTPLLKVLEVLNQVKEARKKVAFNTLENFKGLIDTIKGITDHKLKKYIETTAVEEFNKAAMVSLMYVDPADGQNSFITISEFKDIIDLCKALNQNDMKGIEEYTKFKSWVLHLLRCVRHAINAVCDVRNWMFLSVTTNEEDMNYALAMEDNGLRYRGMNSRMIHDLIRDEHDSIDKSVLSQLANRTIMVRRQQKAITNLKLPTRATKLKAESGYHSDTAKNALHQILIDLANKYPVIQLDLTGTDMETDKYYSGNTLEDALVIYRTN